MAQGWGRRKSGEAPNKILFGGICGSSRHWGSFAAYAIASLGPLSMNGRTMIRREWAWQRGS